MILMILLMCIFRHFVILYFWLIHYMILEMLLIHFSFIITFS